MLQKGLNVRAAESIKGKIVGGRGNQLSQAAVKGRA